MKRQYTEHIPAQVVEHDIITCDNKSCLTVIEDNGVLLGLWHVQTGNEKGDKLLDACSERCLGKAG